MKKPKIREKRGPEAKIQDAITLMLESKGWTVLPTHGNMYMRGFPDLYCGHLIHKQRWIEVKNLARYKFTNAQLERFPLISKFAGIWILTGATEGEYAKLFSLPNWSFYLN